MVGVGDPGTRTTEATADQDVVESAGADIAGVRTILVVMGVSGSGKTTIAKALADRLGWAFVVEATWALVTVWRWWRRVQS
jgi:MoxR-like ATPase